VRTIEHGNLIDAKAAKLLASKKGYMVANLVAYVAMKERAKDFGMTADMLEKNEMVLAGGFKSLEICKRAGVPVGYGSDLLGQLQVDQSREFLLRSGGLEADRDHQVGHHHRREILRMEGKLGIVEPAPSPT